LIYIRFWVFHLKFRHNILSNYKSARYFEHIYAMLIRLVCYDPETNKFGVTLTHFSGNRPWVSLPNVTKASVAGLKLFKLAVTNGCYKCSIVVHVGPIVSVGKNDVIPVGFDLFKYIMTNFTEYTEPTSKVTFASLIKSDVKARIPGFSELDFESKQADIPAIWKELDPFLDPKTKHAVATKFVSDTPKSSKKRKFDPDYPSLSKFSQCGRDDSVSDDEWNNDTS
jgi:hypothetical protein